MLNEFNGIPGFACLVGTRGMDPSKGLGCGAKSLLSSAANHLHDNRTGFWLGRYIARVGTLRCENLVLFINNSD